MAYELRVGGAPKGQFGTEEAAVAAARDVIREDADADVEVFDLETGKPCAPGASQTWRDDLAKRVGF
jgi:hypothetical protein